MANETPFRERRKKAAKMRNRAPSRPVDHEWDSITCVCPKFAPGDSRQEIRGMRCKCKIFIQGKNGEYANKVFDAPMQVDLYPNSRYNDRMFDGGERGQRRHNVGAEKREKKAALDKEIERRYGKDE